MELYTFQRGSTPLLIDIPHAGTFMPEHLRHRLTPAAQPLPDTDWHVDRLYAFARELGPGLLVATHSRYVVDLNRDPSGEALYPGADNTEVCPTRTFSGERIYHEGEAPDAQEIRHRIEHYWMPYHQRLRAELDELVARHGYAILLDGHSIRAEVPRFFSGRLPDLNLGTASGVSADALLIDRFFEVLRGEVRYTRVRDGRFKGGYITRHYGCPPEGINALQLEIAQAAYMDEAPPYAWDASRAQPLVNLLQRTLDVLLAWRP
jgi:N-formylglutamate deformylase